MDRRPFLPLKRSKVGSSSAAPRTAISSTSVHVISCSEAVACSAMSCRIRSCHRWPSFFRTATTIWGLVVAPTAPCDRPYDNSWIEHESFQ